MPNPYQTKTITVFSDGTIGVVDIAPPVTPTPTPPTPTPTPVEGTPVKPGLNWKALKGGVTYVLDDGDYAPIGENVLASGVILKAKNIGKAVIKGKDGDKLFWQGDAKDVKLFGLFFTGGGLGIGNHQAAVRTNDGCYLEDVTVTKSSGTGISIEGNVIRSLRLRAVDNDGSGRGGKADDYIETDSYIGFNNIEKIDKNGGGGKFTRSSKLRFIRMVAEANLGAGIWFDFCDGDIQLIDCILKDQLHWVRKDAEYDVNSTGRGLTIEFDQTGNYLISGCTFSGNDGAGADVAETPGVTFDNNAFLPGRAGSTLVHAAIYVRDITRNKTDDNNKVIGTLTKLLQRLTVKNNTFAEGMTIGYLKGFDNIGLKRNTINIDSTNHWAGQPIVNIENK